MIWALLFLGVVLYAIFNPPKEKWLNDEGKRKKENPYDD